jgi:hypothetical protein
MGQPMRDSSQRVLAVKSMLSTDKNTDDEGIYLHTINHISYFSGL